MNNAFAQTNYFNFLHYWLLIMHTTIGRRDKAWQGKLVATLDTVLREFRDTHPRLQTEPKQDYLIPFLKNFNRQAWRGVPKSSSQHSRRQLSCYATPYTRAAFCVLNWCQEGRAYETLTNKIKNHILRTDHLTQYSRKQIIIGLVMHLAAPTNLYVKNAQIDIAHYSINGTDEQLEA